MTFEAQLSAFLILEADTEEDAAKQALAWQDAIADGEGALSMVERANHIQTVELSLKEVRMV